jgi:hypothetical protein
VAAEVSAKLRSSGRPCFPLFPLKLNWFLLEPNPAYQETRPLTGRDALRFGRELTR